MLEASLRQVMNFYSQHWPEPLAGVILSATAFQEQAEKAIKEAASLPVVPLALVSEVKSTSEWFVAFGCALRGLRAGSKDEEINLSGDGTMDTFREEQVMNFLVLWRVLIPVVLGCLVVILALAANFLGATKVGIGSSGPLAEQGSESADIMALEASATAFNQSVTLVAAAEASENRNYLIVAALNAAAATSSVSISRISFQAPNAPILVSGTASSETQVAAFQAAIQSDPHFGTVTLSTLTAQGAGEGYSFSLSFPLASAF
jgi:Tfp pilus assembly protein PilN